MPFFGTKALNNAYFGSFKPNGDDIVLDPLIKRTKSIFRFNEHSGKLDKPVSLHKHLKTMLDEANSLFQQIREENRARFSEKQKHELEEIIKDTNDVILMHDMGRLYHELETFDSKIASGGTRVRQSVFSKLDRDKLEDMVLKNILKLGQFGGADLVNSFCKFLDTLKTSMQEHMDLPQKETSMSRTRVATLVFELVQSLESIFEKFAKKENHVDVLKQGTLENFDKTSEKYLKKYDLNDNEESIPGMISAMLSNLDGYHDTFEIYPHQSLQKQLSQEFIKAAVELSLGVFNRFIQAPFHNYDPELRKIIKYKFTEFALNKIKQIHTKNKQLIEERLGKELILNSYPTNRGPEVWHNIDNLAQATK